MNLCSLIGHLKSESAIRPTRLEVDLEAVCENAAALHRVSGGVEVFAVVKADAYGHGAVPVARALDAAGRVAGFAVSLVEEGTQLREAGIESPILVMGPALDGGYYELIGRDMLAMVTDPSDLSRLAEIGRRRGRPIDVHLKVDTGMGRLGIGMEEVEPLVEKTLAAGGVNITGIATHFACADIDDPGDPQCMTNEQLRQLRVAVAAAKHAGASPTTVHAANSAATLRFPKARADLVRPGLAVYGSGDAEDLGGQGFRPVVRLVTQVVQLRDVPVGTAVSYGALWRAQRPSRLAILPIGYADGVPKRLTGRAEVLIRGQRCPVVGAVCMDIAVVDVTELGDAAQVGDEVVLLGSQGNAAIRVSEFAERAGLIPWEVTCGITKRVPRVHLYA